MRFAGVGTVAASASSAGSIVGRFAAAVAPPAGAAVDTAAARAVAALLPAMLPALGLGRSCRLAAIHQQAVGPGALTGTGSSMPPIAGGDT
jgi:hypothetical protein